jgi:hypothetical protein
MEHEVRAHVVELKARELLLKSRVQVYETPSNREFFGKVNKKILETS